MNRRAFPWLRTVAAASLVACQAERAVAPVDPPSFAVGPMFLMVQISAVQQSPPLGDLVAELSVNQGIFRADAAGPVQALLTLDLFADNPATGQSRDFPEVGQFLCITKDAPCPVVVGGDPGDVVMLPAVQVPWDGTDDNGAYMGGLLQVSFVARLFLEAPIPTGAVGPMFRPLAVATGMEQVSWAPPVNP